MHDWDDIAETYGPLVWRVAFRVLRDADEAAECHQDVFFEAIRSSARKKVHDWAAYLRWLTVRRAIDRMRRRRRRSRMHDDAVVVDALGVDASNSEVIDWNELIDILRHEVTRIPDAQAQVFWMRCVEQMSMSDVAEQLSVTESHARVLLHRGRERLRDALKRRHPVLVENLHE